MTLFRPCIDLHGGRVKQIVGGTLSDTTAPVTNFVSEESPGAYASRYRSDALFGGHVIMLGPGNEAAATDALAAWPDGMHLGGGITPNNGPEWIDKGAEKVIVTSYLFQDNRLDMSRVKTMREAVGESRLVIDLSCRKTAEGYFVATNRWQTITETPVNEETLALMGENCSEFLVHAADVEGKCQGIEMGLVALLAAHSPIPCTYAGGAKSIDDLARIENLSNGRIDLTFGSALDIFGGTLVRYADCVTWNHARR